MNNLIKELQRRGVITTVLGYLAFSWLILQLVSVLSNMLNFTPLFATGSLIFLVCAAPLVLFVSWHYDFSLQGFTIKAQFEKTDDKKTHGPGLVAWIGLLAIVTLLSFWGVHYYQGADNNIRLAQETQSAINKIDSIAVLPFTDESQIQEQAPLATGLPEEITRLLGGSKLFRVSASRSSQVLAEQGLAPLEIGERLGAQSILTGTITQNSERVNVRVALQDTTSGKVLWTETFMRERKNIFELEREIGKAVANLLKDGFSESGDLAQLSTTNDVDAYVLYLKGKEEYRKQTSESMQAARSYFEQAVAADPEYALAYVALADALALLSEGADGFGLLNIDIAIDLATQNIEKAAAREPNLPDIFAIKGMVDMLKGDNEGAIAAYNKAISLNPNYAIAYMWKSLALTNLQKYEEAIGALRISQSLDPLFLSSSVNLGMLLRWQGRYDEAEKIYKQMIADFPESPLAYAGKADLYYGQGNYVGAIKEWQTVVMLSPDNQAYQDKLLANLSMLGMSDVMKALTNDPFYDATIMIIEERYDELFDKMAFDVAANPDDYWAAFEAGWYHSLFGDATTAAKLLLKNAESVDDTDKFFMPYCSPAIEMAWAHKLLGNDEAALYLIDKCESLLALQREDAIAYSEADYLATRIYALKGNVPSAASALEDAIDNGWREWWTAYDPLLKEVRDNENIARLITFLEQDLDRQREQALALFTD